MFGEQYLLSIRIKPGISLEKGYPFSIPVVQNLIHRKELSLSAPVTFLVGENGTGKSTLLEAIAIAYGFNPEGGNAQFSLFYQRNPL